MKQNQGMNIVKIVDKMVENLTRGGEFPLTLWKVKIILKIMVIRLGVWVILSRIDPIQPIWLVHESRAGVIWVNWGQREIWIYIRIEKNIIESHFTNNHKQIQKSKQQQKERKY